MGFEFVSSKEKTRLLSSLCIVNLKYINNSKMASSSGCSSSNCDEEEEMSSYRKDALSVVTFKLVYDKKNFEKKKFLKFKPAMAHQIFGESESIFGYHSLSVNLYYLHNSSRCYVDLQASGEITSNTPDDIMKSLNEWLPENYTTNEKEFLEMIENEVHDNLFGTVLAEFRDTSQEKYTNYKITLCENSDERFQEFHRRFETYIPWFIDGANYIGLDDYRWLIFYVFEELIHSKSEQRFVTPVGYCTVYNFLAYPNKIRARISQFFVLPSHQRRGIGTHLYQAVIKEIRQNPDVLDITVEEPTSKFQRIRDVDDCSVVYKILKESKIRVSANNLKIILEVMRKFKICRKQRQRLYDILGAFEASHNEDAYKSFLASIKERLCSENERETRGSKRRHSNSVASISKVSTDQKAVIEASFKKYVDDIEQSMKNFRKRLES